MGKKRTVVTSKEDFEEMWLFDGITAQEYPSSWLMRYDLNQYYKFKGTVFLCLRTLEGPRGEGHRNDPFFSAWLRRCRTLLERTWRDMLADEYFALLRPYDDMISGVDTRKPSDLQLLSELVDGRNWEMLTSVFRLCCWSQASLKSPAEVLGHYTFRDCLELYGPKRVIRDEVGPEALDPAEMPIERLRGFCGGSRWCEIVGGTRLRRTVHPNAMLERWETNRTCSIMGAAALYFCRGAWMSALLVVFGIFGDIEGTGAADLIVLLWFCLGLVPSITYALVFYPSYFTERPLLKNSAVVSFCNVLFGFIVFGAVWNGNLTKAKRGISHVVFAVTLVLELLGFAMIAMSHLGL